MKTFIDIFAGAGGLSEGFVMEGFTPLAQIDADATACETLRTRHIFHQIHGTSRERYYFQYLAGELTRKDFYSTVPKDFLNGILNSTISEDSADDLIATVAKRVAAAGVRRVDLLLGGAPCQAYSIIGRSANREKVANDPRLGLYKYYVRFLRHFGPSMFVFENVPGMLSVAGGRIFADLKEAIAEAGYHVDHQVLNAEDHGVLQRRRRVIVFGWRKRLHFDLPDFPTVTHSSTVSAILGDLPSVAPGNDGSPDGYTAPAAGYLRRMHLREARDILTLHLARPHNPADRRIYAEMIRNWRDEGRRLRYQNLPERLRTRKNVTSFTDRYKVVAPDLRYSHTVLAHIAKDGHYYIHPDPAQRRSITVREAARLQSFPDSYFFEGRRAAMFRQIGNAVPPLLSRAVAASFHRVIA